MRRAVERCRQKLTLPALALAALIMPGSAPAQQPSRESRDSMELSIELVDPNLVRAGQTTAFNVRGQVQVKKITGWVNLGPRLSSLTVNDTKTELDNNGFFSKDVSLTGNNTPVSIVARRKTSLMLLSGA